MDGDGRHHVKWSKPGSERHKTACILSYVEDRSKRHVYMKTNMTIQDSYNLLGNISWVCSITAWSHNYLSKTSKTVYTESWGSTLARCLLWHVWDLCSWSSSVPNLYKWFKWSHIECTFAHFSKAARLSEKDVTIAHCSILAMLTNMTF
jgi:hypothetical protein